MAINFRILRPHDLVAVTISGQVRFDDMRNVAGDLSSDPDFVWSHDRIIFLKKDANFSEMSLEDFHRVKDAMKSAFLKDLGVTPPKLPAYRVAVVCSPSMNEIVMRLFGALWEQGDTAPVVAVEDFEHISDALDWLNREAIPESEFAEELMDV